LPGDDVILRQTTSRAASDRYAVAISATDFAAGRLRQKSNVRPNRLFTADGTSILYRAGTLKDGTVQAVIARIIHIVST
jgi:mRNA interferase MazF